MALFSRFFKSDKERQSETVLRRCEASLKGMREAYLEIESGFTPEDQVIMCQPIISSLNLVCGRKGEDRFKPINIQLLLESLMQLHRAGMLSQYLSMRSTLVETQIKNACCIMFSQTMELTEEARTQVDQVAQRLDELVMKLNKAGKAR